MNNGILTQSPQPPAMPYGLLGRPTPVPMPAVDYALDVDAADYIRRVESADGQALELQARLALDAFVRGCKADGIWGAIKASCILAGARTLSGALVPLVGAAPTNFNFVSGDYNRKTGLMGNGSTKFLNSNRNNNAEPVSSISISVYVSTAPAVAVSAYIGTAGGGPSPGSDVHIGRLDATNLFSRVRNSSRNDTPVNSSFTGFVGASRSATNSYTVRAASSNATVTQAVNSSIISLDHFVFARNVLGSLDSPTDARLAFYSIGESLNLALLDARVTTLINTLAAVL